MIFAPVQCFPSFSFIWDFLKIHFSAYDTNEAPRRAPSHAVAEALAKAPEAMTQATSRRGIFIWFLSKPPQEAGYLPSLPLSAALSALPVHQPVAGRQVRLENFIPQNS
jgi:hypothetical protein